MEQTNRPFRLRLNLFDLLVLACDYASQKSCPFAIEDRDAPMMEKGGYRYPQLVFRRKKQTREKGGRSQ